MILREMTSDLMREQKSRIAKLEAENARLMTALESLTPGGSEFSNSPDNCLRFVRDRLRLPASQAIEIKRLRAALRPFADYVAIEVNPGEPDDQAITSNMFTFNIPLTVGDVRNAAQIDTQENEAMIMSENIIQYVNPLSRPIYFCESGKNEIASDFEKLRKLIAILDANLIDKRDECKALEAENVRLRELLETFAVVAPDNDKYLFSNGMTAGELRKKIAAALSG